MTAGAYKVTNQFNSGLLTTVGRNFTLSQDGARACCSDLHGDVAVLDTLTGKILTTYNTGGGTTVLEGSPVAP